MRRISWLTLRRVGPSRHAGLWRAGVWVTLASLLALCLSLPLHGATPSGTAQGAPGAAAVSRADGAAPSSAVTHDFDLCAVCRLASQARLGARLSPLALSTVANASQPTLQLPAPEQPRSPALRDLEPRAPPIALLT